MAQPVCLPQAAGWVNSPAVQAQRSSSPSAYQRSVRRRWKTHSSPVGGEIGEGTVPHPVGSWDPRVAAAERLWFYLHLETNDLQPSHKSREVRLRGLVVTMPENPINSRRLSNMNGDLRGMFPRQFRRNINVFECHSQYLPLAEVFLLAMCLRAMQKIIFCMFSVLDSLQLHSHL